MIACANAQIAYNQAEKDEKNPPDGANPDNLKAAFSRARLNLTAAVAEYQQFIDIVNRTEAELEAAKQAVDHANEQDLTARTKAIGALHKNDSPVQAQLSEILLK
jgi:hypothetical protein